MASSVGSLGSADSASSMQHGGEPELMVGLAYSESTGRLAVEVIKGSNFKNLATSKAPGATVSPHCARCVDASSCYRCHRVSWSVCVRWLQWRTVRKRMNRP